MDEKKLDELAKPCWSFDHMSFDHVSFARSVMHADVKLVQVGPCSCSDHECGECMKLEEYPATTKLDEMVLREKS